MVQAGKLLDITAARPPDHRRRPVRFSQRARSRDSTRRRPCLTTWVDVRREIGSCSLRRSPRRETTHGHLYTCAQGPFRTRLAARWFNRYGRGNPHVHTVADAERLAREAARENLIVEQWLLEEDLTAQEREEMYAFEAYERAVDEGVDKLIPATRTISYRLKQNLSQPDLQTRRLKP